MSKNTLVIVESPAKAKFIQKFLGSGYTVRASMGHVRDLPDKKAELPESQQKLPYASLAIDVNNNFEPLYVIKDAKKDVVRELKTLWKESNDLYIATDEDREGEAIGYHLLQILKVKTKDAKRIVFHEITKPAIMAAIESPREIDTKLFEAQQARRILDRLVGYGLSPLLWKKIRFGLSAGRVQSAAVRIIVDREREIEAFVPEEFWKIKSYYEKPEFDAELSSLNGKRVDNKKVKLESEDEVKKLLTELKGKDHTVGSIEEKDAVANPAPPFTTSTLQQEASRKLGYGVKQTMMIAQKLYEGNVKKKGGVDGGFITYMRTDSVNLSAIALAQAKEVISSEFGKEYSLDTPRYYKTSSKGAQEAHEAIRPTNLKMTPDEASKYLDSSELKLYSLIWKRTLACQMAQAKLKRTTATISVENTNHEFQAKGKVVVFPGFMKVYREDRDEGEPENTVGDDQSEDSFKSTEDRELPPLKVGQKLNLRSVDALEKKYLSDKAESEKEFKFQATQLFIQGLTAHQSFTKPPPRYTEASLVKKMEAEGIGRPSTYAPTINTIQVRGYVEKTEDKKLKPTDIGKIVNDFLVEHFPEIVDLKFTAKMETGLDDVAEGKQKWVELLNEFYWPFEKNIKGKDKKIDRADVMKGRELGVDPKSGKPITVRMGRFGPFIQRGTKEDADKPDFAPLRNGITLEAVNLEQALELLKLPRTIGQTTDGQDVTANIGRFGPYVKIGENYFSIKDDDPYTITLQKALEIIASEKERKAKAQLKIFEGSDIKVLDGKYGPYITDGKKNAKIPKESDPKSLTLEQCQKLIEVAPARGKRRWGRKKF